MEADNYYLIVQKQTFIDNDKSNADSYWNVANGNESLS